MPATITKFETPNPSPRIRETIWRGACRAFLFAALNGAPRDELRTLTDALYRARWAMVMDQPA